MKTVLTWQLPIKTASESNSSEHWTKKAQRHNGQKKHVKAIFLRDRPQIKLPVHVVITRISPRSLDAHDNLPMSLKWICDAVAENIILGKAPGRADDSEEITWEYKQEKGGPQAVRIEILESTLSA